jgi:hypothetical protein
VTDVVAARHAALRLASFEAFAALFLLVRGEDRLAAELDAFVLGVGPTARGAFEDLVSFELLRNAEYGENDLGKIGRGIEERLGQERIPAPARCMSRAITRRSFVSRDCRSAGVITTSPCARTFISLASCGRTANFIKAVALMQISNVRSKGFCSQCPGLHSQQVFSCCVECRGTRHSAKIS